MAEPQAGAEAAPNVLPLDPAPLFLQIEDFESNRRFKYWLFYNKNNDNSDDNK